MPTLTPADAAAVASATLRAIHAAASLLSVIPHVPEISLVDSLPVEVQRALAGLVGAHPEDESLAWDPGDCTSLQHVESNHGVIEALRFNIPVPSSGPRACVQVRSQVKREPTLEEAREYAHHCAECAERVAREAA